MDEPRGQDDYVWHFRISDSPGLTEDTDPVTGMVREQVEALLRCVTFTDGGKDVRVTGFRFLNGEKEVPLRSSQL
jgi:hypothetical protein